MQLNIFKCLRMDKDMNLSPNTTLKSKTKSMNLLTIQKMLIKLQKKQPAL